MDKDKFVRMGQGPAKLIESGSDEDKKDTHGFTQPNLHRRVDPKEPNSKSNEVSPKEYELGVYGFDSYRTTKINYHDEESETSEIP